MAKELLTDEQVAEEVARLKESEYVRLAQKEIRLKSKRRKYLYQLRWLEKRGKQLAADGVTLEKVDQGLMVHVNDLDEIKRLGVRDGLKAILAGLIALACGIVTLTMFRKLCEAFSVCRTPFDEAVIARMTTFAWTLIVCAVVGCFATAAASAVVAGFSKMNFNLSLTPIFTALIVFFLCMVFRYGAQLQREADETL